MASATQHAPEKQAQRSANSSAEKEKRGPREALYNLPQAAGVAIMAALLVLSPGKKLQVVYYTKKIRFFVSLAQKLN